MSKDLKNQKDPVCGMSVNSEKCAYTKEHDHKKYCFCSQECLTKFNKDPKHFSK